VNPWFKEFEAAYQLNDSGATSIVAGASAAELLRRVIGGSPLEDIVLVGGDGPLPDGWCTWEDAAVPGSAPAACDPDAVAVLNYTGGTTGLPKGCEHTQRDMVYTAETATAAQGIDGTDEVSLVYISVFWIAGEDYGIVMPVYTGTTTVLLTRWNVEAALDAIETHRVTSCLGTVDNFVELLDVLERSPRDVSSLRTPLTMSFVTRLTPAIRARWASLARGAGVIREAGFGMTETHAVDTATRGFQDGDEDLLSRPVFCGRTVPGTEMRVVDFATGEPVAPGGEGELVIRSPSLFKRYWNRPEESRVALRDGWFHTGDIAMIDERGLVHLLGRRKEMIKVNGMSVYPAEIEVVLVAHPDVVGCGVVRVPNAERGELPVAFVQLSREGADAVDLLAWCAERLVSYKLPEIRVVDALPLTTAGKIRKDALLAML
jgi:acyl-CoA synthetase (AMP-forming)/AMP-acid ligase II